LEASTLRRVEGKVAFITGAARGQGRAHAVRLAEEGADVIAVDICEPLATVPYDMGTAADLEETVREVEALGARIVARQADVRDLAALTAAVEAGVAELGPLDLVVANAGICSYDTAAAMSEDVWQEMIDINLTGAWKTIKASAPHLNDGASIVLTSSVVGIKGFPNIAHYAAAKHGLVGLMQSVAHELSPRGIRVNSIHPATVNTRMVHNRASYELFRPDLEEPGRADFEEVAADIHLLPGGPMDPIEIANAVLFLASDEARCISGVALPIDAGILVK
jgi:(+)-trans-carveol dehydrogenase